MAKHLQPAIDEEFAIRGHVMFKVTGGTVALTLHGVELIEYSDGTYQEHLPTGDYCFCLKEGTPTIDLFTGFIY